MDREFLETVVYDDEADTNHTIRVRTFCCLNYSFGNRKRLPEY